MIVLPMFTVSGPTLGGTNVSSGGASAGGTDAAGVVAALAPATGAAIPKRPSAAVAADSFRMSMSFSFECEDVE
jgi:hypothetical protein